MNKDGRMISSEWYRILLFHTADTQQSCMVLYFSTAAEWNPILSNNIFKHQDESGAGQSAAAIRNITRRRR